MNTIILIPTYNERGNITRLVPHIFDVLPQVTVAVIDDGSPDGTGDAVRAMQPKFPGLKLFQRQKKEGLGRAYMAAFERVFREYPAMDIICTMDADFSHDPTYLPTMLEHMKHTDVVIGSRYVAGGRVQGWEPWRKILSAVGNRYCRLITRLPLSDCTSGFTCMRTSALKKVDFSDFDTSGYAFLMYLKYKLWKLGTTIHEHPICFTNRVEGESKISMNIIHEGILLPWRLKRQAKKHLPRTRCPLCNDTSGIYWFHKNGHAVYRCSYCLLVFISPLPDTTATVYEKDYFCGAHHGYGYVDYDKDKEADLPTFSRYLDEIEALCPTKGSLLDVGAATGSFLAVARQRGWDVTGIEISDYAAGAARAKGLNVHTGTITNIPLSPGSFDVITLWDVIEHVTDIDATMQALRAALKPHGILILNTPDAQSVYARIMGTRWPLIIPPEHIHLFCEYNLKQLLTRHHFSWVKKTRIGKTYQPAYVLQILYTVNKQRVWKLLSDWIRKTPLNRCTLPIHVRDNMFVIARKNEDRTR